MKLETPDVNATYSIGRLDAIDLAKAAGMFLVFFGHAVERLVLVSGAPGALEQMRFVYAFHMPMFFLLSGVFFRPVKTGVGEFVLRKLRTRIVPVLFFALLALPFWFAKEQGIVVPLRRAGSYLTGNPSLNTPTWFLVCLCMVEIMAGLLGWWRPFRDRVRLVCFLLVAVVLGYVIDEHGPRIAGLMGLRSNAWYWQEALVALPFYLVGVLLGDVIRRPPGTRVLLGVAALG